MNLHQVWKLAAVAGRRRIFRADDSEWLRPIARAQWNGHIYVFWPKWMPCLSIARADIHIGFPYALSVDDFIADDWELAAEPIQQFYEKSQ